MDTDWCNWQDWRKSLFPSMAPDSWLTSSVFAGNKAGELTYFPKLEKGDPQRCASLQARRCSSEKARRVLGIQFKTLPETLKDTLDYYRQRGWLAEYEA